MLRSPNEIVTASNVRSANGSRVASPATKGSRGRARFPTSSIPAEKSHGTTLAPSNTNGRLLDPVPAATSRTGSPGRGVDRREHGPPPAPILTERQHRG
jgi:hypothetical protein